jgi:3',5'-cyclic AMP phosphodiesterase CpdA
VRSPPGLEADTVIAERRKDRKAVFAAVFVAALSAALSGCLTAAPGERFRGNWPAARFAVLSDPHVADPSLGVPGPLSPGGPVGGAKLLAESAALLEEAVTLVGQQGVQFLLVPGDLTKDGERVSHERAAAELGRLAAAGIAVYVVPGNHDVANPHAARWAAGAVERVPTVTPGEFASIYRGLGYGAAISRDASSLSYAAEPVPGLWLLAVDSCRYRENGDSPVSGGRIGTPTLRWMEGVLEEARLRGAHVIAFMHHGLAEHFRGQGVLMGNSLAADRREAADILRRGGVRIVFTGHGHAQDVAEDREGGAPGFLFDVETGSSSSWPNPWRTVELSSDGRARIRSLTVSLPGNGDFPAYSLSRMHDAVASEAWGALRRAAIPREDARLIAEETAEAAREYFRGDESGESPPPPAALGLWAADIRQLMGPALDALRRDSPPPDNDVVLDLEADSWGG